MSPGSSQWLLPQSTANESLLQLPYLAVREGLADADCHQLSHQLSFVCLLEPYLKGIAWVYIKVLGRAFAT